MPSQSPQDLARVFASLSGEICRPLEMLRTEIERLQLEAPGFESEMSQAVTMLALCDDLSRLTRETLETNQSQQS